MSAEDNKSLVRRFVEEVNKHNVTALDEILAPNFSYHSPTYGDLDREGYKKAAASILTSYPDYHVSIDDLMAAEGDKVAVRLTDRGTDKGGSPALGTPPTGKQIAVPGIGIVAIEGRRIAEIWIINDSLGAMQQLGLIPRRG